MSSLPWILVFAVAVLAFVYVAGKRRWDAYFNMARIRPDERVLHEEDCVTVKTKAWAAPPFYDWTWAGGGPDEYGLLRGDVIITNERILVFQNGLPCSIVNFARPVTLPGSWPAWREGFLMNVTGNDIRVAEDDSGKPCLEVMYSPRRGRGVRTRYYLRELEAAGDCFPQALTSIGSG